MSPGADDDFADDSWSEASEGEQQAWLRSALIECDTKPVEVDPRYEISIEPVDFTSEISGCTGISFDVDKTPIKRIPGPATHCSVSASMPNFDFKLLRDNTSGKVADILKSKMYPRRRSAETGKSAKQKHTVPGFMRDTEAWSKRRSISTNVQSPKSVAIHSILKRPASNSAFSKSVCGIPSKLPSAVSQSEIMFKAKKPGVPSGLKSDRGNSLKRKFPVKRPITKRSIYLPILRNPPPGESADDKLVMRSVQFQGSVKQWDQMLLHESVQWPPSSQRTERKTLSSTQSRVYSDISKQHRVQDLSIENFANSQLPGSSTGFDAFDSEDLGDDTCLMGLFNDESSFEQPLARSVSDKMNVDSEVEQLRKALSDVSIMYQDQVQSLKKQLFSTLEQFEYDQKQIAFLKRKLAESLCIDQARGR